MNLSDVSLAKEALELLTCAGMDREAIKLSGEFAPEVLEVGRVKTYIILAHLHLGHIEEAEDFFFCDGGLTLPDIREGELIVTDMYLMLEELKAKRDGREFDREKTKVPPQFDYRQGDSAFQ